MILNARIYELFPLLSPVCGGQMRLIAFITEGAQIRKLLEHIGVAFDADQRLNWRQDKPSGSDSLWGEPVSGVRGAPESTLPDSAF